MLKLACRLASIALITVPCLATSVSAESSCYMVTSSGQKINLGSMCSNRGAASPARNASPSYRPQATESVSQTTAYGSTLVQEGRGGRVFNGTAEDYHYQIWATSNSSGYRLVVWREQDFPDGSPLAFLAFKSVGDALDFFDCTYTDKSIPACPRNRVQNYYQAIPRQTITNTITAPTYSPPR
jgi:hypothetical protein